jgi:phosphoribosylformylglycinamidine synthase
MIELGLIDNNFPLQSNGAEDRLSAERLLQYKQQYAQMQHNDSHKFESTFVTLQIPQNDSVMFGSLSGKKIGCWVAHGEGKFHLPQTEDKYNIVAKYNRHGYPANPNGSDYDVAALASADGRHLAIMPHPERTQHPWQCGYYPVERRLTDTVTPWHEAFVNARKWVEERMK